MSDPIKFLEPLPNSTDFTVQWHLPLGTITIPNNTTDTANFLRGDGTWAVPPGGGGGGFSKCEEFTASGTFTPEAGVTCVWLTMIAGGGGAANNTVSGGGGGGSGEYCVRHPVPVSGPVTVTIGAGGAGAAGDGSAHTGSDGEDTSFGLLIVRGGLGGGLATKTDGGQGGGPRGGGPVLSGTVGAMGTGESPTFFGGSSGGGGGAITLGVSGGNGSPGAGYPDGAVAGVGNGGEGGGGGGASSLWGLGGAGGSSAAGTDATVYGTGGGGASGKPTGTYKGGDGADGYCIVEWIGS